MADDATKGDSTPIATHASPGPESTGNQAQDAPMSTPQKDTVMQDASNEQAAVSLPHAL